MWGRVREAHDAWASLGPFQRENWLTRISEGMGVFRAEAQARIEGTPCAHCGSMNVDRGDNFCNDCQRLGE